MCNQNVMIALFMTALSRVFAMSQTRAGQKIIGAQTNNK
jgi:hypothetical protein